MRHETLDRPNLASRKKIRRAFSSKSHSRPSLVVRTDGKRHHRSRFPVSVKRYATTIFLCSSLLRRLCEHSILETRTKLMNFLSCDFHRNAPSRGIPLDATRSEPFKFSVFFFHFSLFSLFFFLSFFLVSFFALSQYSSRHVSIVQSFVSKSRGKFSACSRPFISFRPFSFNRISNEQSFCSPTFQNNETRNDQK